MHSIHRSIDCCSLRLQPLLRISWVSNVESFTVAPSVLSQMSKSSKKSPQKKSGGRADDKSGFSALPIAVFVVGAGVLIWMISSSFRASDTPEVARDEDAPANAASEASLQVEDASAGAASEEEKPEPLSDADRQRLLGFWERTDNPPYSIEIRLVRPNGLTDARYYNPRNGALVVANHAVAGKLSARFDACGVTVARRAYCVE